MADKTREEVAQEAADAATKAGEKYAADQKAAAEKARAEAPDVAETEEEYYARRARALQTGIFGDVDTTAGVSVSLTDVPSANNEDATVAVAEKDATGTDASDDEARRQADAAAKDETTEGDGAADDAPADDKKASTKKS